MKDIFFAVTLFLVPTGLFAQPSTNEIVFAGSDGQIYSVRSDGTGQAQLTSDPTTKFSPNRSPDGSKIVYTRPGTVGRALYVMNADGTAQQQLADVGYAENPVWSPNGSKIAFDCSSSINASDICVVNANGSNFVRLTLNKEYFHSYATDWSPDGTKIAYWKYDENADTCGIYVVNADGTGQTAITNSPRDNEAQWVPRWNQECVAK